MLRLRNVGVYDGRLRHNMTAGKAPANPPSPLAGSALAAIIDVSDLLFVMLRAKKSPHAAGKITGFYRGITQGHHTTFDGFKISNPVYGFVITR